MNLVGYIHTNMYKWEGSPINNVDVHKLMTNELGKNNNINQQHTFSTTRNELIIIDIQINK